MTLHEIPYVKTPEKEFGWFFRFDLRLGLRGQGAAVTKMFELPFAHIQWCGPFNCQDHAMQAAHDAFGHFMVSDTANSKKRPL